MFSARGSSRLEALEFLKAVLPEVNIDADPHSYSQAMDNIAILLHDLGRYHECLDTALELITFTKANYGPDHLHTLIAIEVYALA